MTTLVSNNQSINEQTNQLIERRKLDQRVVLSIKNNPRKICDKLSSNCVLWYFLAASPKEEDMLEISRDFDFSPGYRKRNSSKTSEGRIGVLSFC